jgi:hypothetical protein
MNVTNTINAKPFGRSVCISGSFATAAAVAPTTTRISAKDALALHRKRQAGEANLSHPPILSKRRRCVSPYTGRKRLSTVEGLASLEPLLLLDFLGENDVKSTDCASRPKRVNFTNPLVQTTADVPATLMSDTWYNDCDYHAFQLDCRRAVMAARQTLLTTGDLDEDSFYIEQEHQLELSTLLGLEHFMSPTMERARKARCVRHVQDILAQHWKK